MQKYENKNCKEWDRVGRTDNIPATGKLMIAMNSVQQDWRNSRCQKHEKH